VVGNKSDNYEEEQVQDIEAKYLAKKLNALFHTTSAKTGLGIDELFKKIGRQCINPDMTLMSQSMRQEVSLYSDNIKLKATKTGKKKKKKFC
jgi:Fe2+ transport system protein B